MTCPIPEQTSGVEQLKEPQVLTSETPLSPDAFFLNESPASQVATYRTLLRGYLTLDLEAHFFVKKEELLQLNK